VKIDLTGLIELGDSCRVYDDEDDGAIQIGGVDLVRLVDEKQFGRPVTVAIMDERYEGDLSVDLGWGYSEYTPVDSDKLTVGDHDLIKILERLDGQTIRIVISDGPVDLGE
jgi:hypothetical protein